MVSFTITHVSDAGEYLVTLTGRHFELPEDHGPYSGLYTLTAREDERLSFRMFAGEPGLFSLNGLVDEQGTVKLVTVQWRGSVALTMNALAVAVGSQGLSLPDPG
jgi:hypothetical protein